MIYKTLILVVMIALFLGVNKSNAQVTDPCAELVTLENAIVAADLETATCQMEFDWHFPVSFYNHIRKAKEYCVFRKNGKMTKKTYNSLQGLHEAITEAIEGEEGYFVLELWIDPVPAVHDCAQPVLEGLKTEVKNMMLNFE